LKRTEKVKTFAGIGLILGGMFILYFSLRVPPPMFDARPQEALGQVLAEEAAKMLGSVGRVTLITLDPSAFNNPAIQFQVSGFERAAKQLKMAIAATNFIKLDPLRLMRVPAGDFLEIMRKLPEGDVVVSLLGPPLLNSAQMARLGEKRPRILAVCSGPMPQQVNLPQLFDQDLLHLAVISRVVPLPSGAAPENPREMFNQRYRIITSANLSELPRWANNLPQ
jgi:hypothetical protein